MENALELGIKGFVANRPDGTVEIEAEGNDDVIEKFIEWCHEGPPKARVTKVDIHEQGLKNYTSFIIKR